MTIGRHSVVGGGRDLDAIIGNFTAIGEGIYVHHGDNHAVIKEPNLVSNFSFGGWYPCWPNDGYNKGDVVIDHDVWIGRDVRILTGVHIHSGAIVAAHSVVTKDVPPYAMVAGNPATIKKFRFPPDTIRKLLTIAWWNWTDDHIKERLGDMVDIAVFLEKWGMNL